MESPVTGLERIVLDHDLRARAIGARHIGLIANFTSVTRDYPNRCMRAIRNPVSIPR